jgi:hypothetical protein
MPSFIRAATRVRPVFHCFQMHIRMRRRTHLSRSLKKLLMGTSRKYPTQAPPELPADAGASPMESHLARQSRRPLAVAGVVEHGLVRPLDPTVQLPERSRVIIVAAEEN